MHVELSAKWMVVRDILDPLQQQAWKKCKQKYIFICTQFAHNFQNLTDCSRCRWHVSVTNVMQHIQRRDFVEATCVSFHHHDNGHCYNQGQKSLDWLSLFSFIHPFTELTLFFCWFSDGIVTPNSCIQMQFSLPTPCFNVALNSGVRASMMWINIENGEWGKSLVITLQWSNTFGPDCSPCLLFIFWLCTIRLMLTFNIFCKTCSKKQSITQQIKRLTLTIIIVLKLHSKTPILSVTY